MKPLFRTISYDLVCHAPGCQRTFTAMAPHAKYCPLHRDAIITAQRRQTTRRWYARKRATPQHCFRCGDLLSDGRARYCTWCRQEAIDADVTVTLGPDRFWNGRPFVNWHPAL